ncbi:reverse transcriptase domain-containing protein [Aeromicrobium sp. Root495]|uniref:reverse transcriptase domain-containing protein n=1 Tax=Aeromicrobium sp. Root495 TaxID=1736550 RepID=UPI0022868A8E|nr:reverse transcriptase domain-containing protein [Aeromicrobium sp. Root495]
MRAGKFRFTNYREGLASRGRDRPPRVFAIPTVRDRLALSAMKDCLADVYLHRGPEPPQRKINRVVDAVNSGAYSHYLKIDIQDYFGSIQHDVLLRRVRRQVRTDRLLDLIDRALRNPTVAFGQRSGGLTSASSGLPLGLSISSLLAELYLSDFDLQHKSRAYFRYVDDILVLSSGAPASLTGMQNDLRSIGLSTHPLGTPGKCEEGRISSGFQYLGYQFNGRSVNVSDAGIRKIESQLARLISQAGKTLVDPQADRERKRLLWRLDLLIGGCVIDGYARGWIRYYNRVDALHELARLDSLVDKLLRRYALLGSPKPKRFISAFWASKDNLRFRHYAFDLDAITPGRARRELVDLEGLQPTTVTRMSDTEAMRTYRRLVRRHVLEMERDLEPAS